jgi:type IV pilus assembly protein PilW
MSLTTRPFDAASAVWHREAGVTLIELMVALVLGLLIVAAAVAALIIGRQGFTSVDSSTQLRENGRFAASLIERIAVQAGFENAAYGMVSGAKPPGLRGFDNSLVSAGSLPDGLTHGSRTSGNCGGFTDTSCMNGSDVLMVRFWGVSRAGSADGSMINCAGIPEPEAAPGQGPAFSVFHVVRGSDGEPTLVCSYRDPTTLTWATVPLVKGVEALQVLYGTDGVAPNVCAGDATTGADSVAERYLHASQLDGASGTYCANNWARVRSVRIGLLVRGPVGSAAVREAKTWPVLSAPGAAYSFIDASNDPGSSLDVPADGRLRQQMVFTVHLRNAQYSP